MSEYTPGPWEVNAHDDAHLRYYIIVSDRGVVAEVERFESECGLADARLIAASPDLLEALEFVLAFAEATTHEGECPHTGAIEDCPFDPCRKFAPARVAFERDVTHTFRCASALTRWGYCEGGCGCACHGDET